MLDVSLHELTRVYLLDGITYVPHYQDRNLYVGPGYPVGQGKPKLTHTYTAAELLDAGAKQDQMLLWSRPQFAVPTSN